MPSTLIVMGLPLEAGNIFSDLFASTFVYKTVSRTDHKRWQENDLDNKYPLNSAKNCYRQAHISHVEIFQVSPHVEKFQISSEHRFFCDLRYFVVQLFCRAFAWRKIELKNLCVEKNDKYQVCWSIITTGAKPSLQSCEFKNVLNLAPPWIFWHPLWGHRAR